MPPWGGRREVEAPTSRASPASRQPEGTAHSRRGPRPIRAGLQGRPLRHPLVDRRRGNGSPAIARRVRSLNSSSALRIDEERGSQRACEVHPAELASRSTATKRVVSRRTSRGSRRGISPVKRQVATVSTGEIREESAAARGGLHRCAHPGLADHPGRRPGRCAGRCARRPGGKRIRSPGWPSEGYTQGRARPSRPCMRMTPRRALGMDYNINERHRPFEGGVGLMAAACEPTGLARRDPDYGERAASGTADPADRWRGDAYSRASATATAVGARAVSRPTISSGDRPCPHIRCIPAALIAAGAHRGDRGHLFPPEKR